MLAATDLQAILPGPNSTLIEEESDVAHCPLCLTPGLLSDRECKGCGVPFEDDTFACASCFVLVGAEAHHCPACGAPLGGS